MQKKKCPGNACSGKPATARVVDIQFANVDQGDLVFDPQPTTEGGNAYNLVKNPALRNLLNGKPAKFWDVVHHGGTGRPGNGNFDVGILMEDGTWLHSDGQGAAAKYSTAQQMDKEFIRLSPIDNPGEIPDDKPFAYWFNTRFWCVVCETEWKNGKAVAPKI
jgi:hypothetical protein